MPRQSGRLTAFLVSSVAMADCLTLLVIWYEVFYKVVESWPETAMAVGQGIGISMAVTVLAFGNLEVIVLISLWIMDQYRKKRYQEAEEAGHRRGEETGRRRGEEAGRQRERDRIRALLEQSGVKLDPTVEESLFGASVESEEVKWGRSGM